MTKDKLYLQGSFLQCKRKAQFKLCTFQLISFIKMGTHALYIALRAITVCGMRFSNVVPRAGRRMDPMVI